MPSSDERLSSFLNYSVANEPTPVQKTRCMKLSSDERLSSFLNYSVVVPF